MATTYNTLSLEREEEPRKQRSIATYVAGALALVALAGISSVVVSNKTNNAIDAEFDDFKGDVVDCWGKLDARGRIELEATLPRYDKTWSGTADSRRAFYNACYYSYSCCTEVSLDCLASEGYGQKCEACLFSNGPRMVKPICTNYIKESGKGFGKKELMEDNGIPSTRIQKYARVFKKWAKTAKKNGVKPSCWKRVGSQDGRMNKFVQNCWDAISWCNLLCPRDDDDTVDEKMCKECINMGFQREAPRRFINGHTFKEVKDKYGRISGLSTKFGKKSKAELKKAEESLEREIGKNANNKDAAKF